MMKYMKGVLSIESSIKLGPGGGLTFMSIPNSPFIVLRSKIPYTRAASHISIILYVRIQGGDEERNLNWDQSDYK